MDNEVREIIEWFENLLDVDGLTFKYSKDNLDASILNGYEFEREVLTRKLLYFDPTNNVITTHSPYGTHWENRKDVKKIVSTDNFRWCCKGDEYLSCFRPSYIELEDYNGDIEMIKHCNEDKIMRTLNMVTKLSKYFK